MADPLSITASIVAVLQLAATAADYLKGVKSGSRARVRLRDELRSTACLIEMIKDRAEDAHDAEETLRPALIAGLVEKDGPLSMFDGILKHIITKLEPRQGARQVLSAIMWPFDQKEIGEMLSTMERLKSSFNLVLQNDAFELAKLQSTKLEGVIQQLDNLETMGQSQEKETMLQWLSTTNPRAKQASILESVQEGTGEWFLDHADYCRWVVGYCKILYCPGIPGAGKTRLASLIVKNVEDHEAPDMAFAYIYCDYASRDSQTSLKMISSLLEQILRRAPSGVLPQEVLELYQMHQKYDTRPNVEEMLRVFKQVTSRYKVLYVVVDALDECSETEEATLSFLELVLKLHDDIRLLCTSRPSIVFNDFFAQHSKINISAAKEDIQAFLRGRVHEQARLSRHLQADTSLEDDIVSSITEKAQGMFLLAKLQIESLARKLSRKDVRSALKTLPKTLDSIYEQTLERVRHQADEDVVLAESILRWIAWSSRTITLSELQHMYAVQQITNNEPLEEDDLPDAQALTGVCGGLLIVEDRLRTVRMVHYTAQEFLLRVYLPDEIPTKITLADLCLRYLTLPNFASGACETDKSMADRLRDYPFLEYAATCWGYEDEAADNGELLKAVIKFMETDYAIATANQAASISRFRYRYWSQDYPKDVPGVVLAASFSLPTFLKSILASSSNLEIHGSDGETPLIRSAKLGFSRNVTILLDLGANVNAEDSSGETPLYKAVAGGHTQTVSILLQHVKVEEIETSSSSKWTHLMLAVVSGNMDVIRILVEAGFSVNMQTIWGESALSLATRNGQEDIANYLADHGAVLHQNATGRRASRLAIGQGLATLVRRLTINYEEVADRGLERHPAGVANQLPVVEESNDDLIARLGNGLQDANTDWEEALSDLTATLGHSSTFSQRYQRIKFLGKGHFAQVSVCQNKVTGVQYAAKERSVVKLRGTAHGYDMEIKALTTLKHDNIIRYIDTVLSDDSKKVISILELATETDLFNLVVMRQKLKQQETRDVFSQLFSALDYMHGEGWVHCDIKPENIMFTSLTPPEIKLIDFDVAGFIPKEPPDGKLTVLVGTPTYVAPEILASDENRKFNHMVDIWSAGVVLYICLCGFPPFSDELYTEANPYSLSQQIKEGRFDYPSPYWDNIPDSALELIDDMLTVDVSRRRTLAECIRHPWMLEVGEQPGPGPPIDNPSADNPPAQDDQVFAHLSPA